MVLTAVEIYMYVNDLNRNSNYLCSILDPTPIRRSLKQMNGIINLAIVSWIWDVVKP